MVIRVDVDVPTLAPWESTAAYVVPGDPAAERGGLLLDPADRTGDLDEAIAANEVTDVAVTHHHRDHVGGLAEYADEYDLTVWALTGRTDAFAEATGVDPDRTFRPGEELPAGGGVVVRDTPGHAPEHVAFEVEGGLATGDLAVAEGSVVVGAPQGDMRAYLSSLRRVQAAAPDRLFPAHGPEIGDPRATCTRLIEHRYDRERRVREAVEGGASTTDEILDAAYEKDISGVREAARATVVAHLEKLAVEGDLDWDGDRARA